MRALLVLFLSYFVLGKVGLTLNAVSGFATLLWAPTGIALYAVLVRGNRVWPAIAAAAWLLNWLEGAPLLVALGIACGNTLEALVGAWLLNQALPAPWNLRKLRTVIIFTALGPGLSTLVSSIIGTASLRAGGIVSSADLFVTWQAWWAGDMLGSLVIVPLLLSWISPSPTRQASLRVIVEGLGLLGFTMAAAIFSFGVVESGRALFPYIFFPLVVWSSLRFGPRGSSTSTLLISIGVIASTLLGYGPFGNHPLDVRIVLLQSFVGILALVGMVLSAMLTERDDAIRARDDFISIASHELKTPISVMKLQVQSLVLALDRSKTPSLDRETMLRYCEASDKQLSRISRLVNDMLDAGQVNSGKLSIEVGHMDLGELIEEIVHKLQPQLEAAQCAIDVRLEAHVQGEWDRQRLEQVFLNLLGNAIKYAPGCPVHIDLRRSGTLARVAVRDGGRGIAPEFHQKIFERFERLVSPTSVSGLGLGLYISKQIIERHGGTIQVESEPNKGAGFIVELPLEAASM